MPPVSATRFTQRGSPVLRLPTTNYQLPTINYQLSLRRLQLRGRRVLRRRQPLLDERIPLVTLWTLPEQLRAAVAAARADVRVEVEDRVAGQRHVAADERRIPPERGERLPDLLVDGEAVRVQRKRLEQPVERFTVTTLRGQVFRQREPRPPVLRILRDEPLAQLREPSRRAERRIRPLATAERQMRAAGSLARGRFPRLDGAG